jgi:DNA excision repair protein ERCC-2
MRFDLEGLDVFFPYDKLYHEQYEYMLNLKRAIDAKGHALLEMPTGTGKTVCLVSLVTSYQFQYPQTGKLIYCTRTVQEMFKCMDEIRRVIAYRESMVGPAGGKVLALCLSSRKNMCIHPRVEAGVDREAVDSICRSMTATWVRQSAGKAKVGERGGRGSSGTNNNSSSSSSSRTRNSSSSSSSSAPGAGTQSAPDIEDVTLCGFYEKYAEEESAAEIPGGVYSLDDLKALGKEKGWCPYFVARHMLNRANIVVYNYQYMLDPKVANLVSRELEQESIVVFDEAHNIDNVCIEAFSITLDRRKMDASLRGVHRLAAKITEQVNRRKEDFQNEYQQLVQGLISEGTWAAADQGRGNPILTEDQLQEAVPGSIRKNEHFVAFLKKIVVYVFCSSFFLFAMSLSLSRSITSCLHSLTPHSTCLTIISSPLNQPSIDTTSHIAYYNTGTTAR